MPTPSGRPTSRCSTSCRHRRRPPRADQTLARRNRLPLPRPARAGRARAPGRSPWPITPASPAAASCSASTRAGSTATRIIGTGPAVSEDRTDDDGLAHVQLPADRSARDHDLRAARDVHQRGHHAAIRQRARRQRRDHRRSRQAPDLAPTPRPGPVMAIDIPRLKLHSGVLQVAWEPPPFTVGQIKDTANITQGNTVLVGHLTRRGRQRLCATSTSSSPATRSPRLRAACRTSSSSARSSKARIPTRRPSSPRTTRV